MGAIQTPDDRPTIAAIVGNGELVTRVGPSGYHRDEGASIDEALFWSGRRLDGPYYPLVRFGKLMRSIAVYGASGHDGAWRQWIDYERGMVCCSVDHGLVTERTETLIASHTNVLLISTVLTNCSSDAVSVDFEVRYQFGDHEGTVQEGCTLVPGREPENHIVEVRTRGFVAAVFVRADWAEPVPVRLGLCRLRAGFTLPAGGQRRLRTWLVVADAARYTHPPRPEQIDGLVKRHVDEWQAFWRRGWIQLDEPALMDLWRCSMYTLRCSATPWSIPPSVGPYWDGRTFHDELYPFLALASAGHLELARRIPYFRLRTLDRAVQRSAGRGARYPWESTETGLEGVPFGAHMDEHFHIGQISETAWQYLLFAGDEQAAAELYPLLRECAEYYRQNMIELDGQTLTIRPCTDYEESIYPVARPIYTTCAAIRSLENAAAAARRLRRDAALAAQWQRTAAGLRASLPTTRDGGAYATASGANFTHIATAGVVFPFRVDEVSKRARRTIIELLRSCRSSLNFKPGSHRTYDGSNWMWTTAHLATALFYQHRGREGWDVLRLAPASAGPLASPNEHTRGQTIAIPWFTTAAGAVVYAIHAMCVRVVEGQALLLTVLPAEIGDCAFELAGGAGVQVRCRVAAGRVAELAVSTPRPKRWACRIPIARLSADRLNRRIVSISPDPDAETITLCCDLPAGRTDLLRPEP